MVSLGFPWTLRRARLTQSDLAKISGNTMSIHVHSVLLVCLLCCADLTTMVEILQAHHASTPSLGSLMDSAIFEITPHVHNIPEDLEVACLPGLRRTRAPPPGSNCIIFKRICSIPPCWAPKLPSSIKLMTPLCFAEPILQLVLTSARRLLEVESTTKF